MANQQLSKRKIMDDQRPIKKQKNFNLILCDNHPPLYPSYNAIMRRMRVWPFYPSFGQEEEENCETETTEETKESTCWGCINDHPSQKYHMDYGGCLADDSMYMVD